MTVSFSDEWDQFCVSIYQCLGTFEELVKIKASKEKYNVMLNVLTYFLMCLLIKVY